MKKFFLIFLFLLPVSVHAVSVTCTTDEGLVGGRFYDYIVNAQNEVEIVPDDFVFPDPITIKLDDDFNVKAINALENHKGIINYSLGENSNFTLFISTLDYMDGRFIQRNKDQLIILDTYCEFDVIDGYPPKTAEDK